MTVNYKQNGENIKGMIKVETSDSRGISFTTWSIYVMLVTDWFVLDGIIGFKFSS